MVTNKMQKLLCFLCLSVAAASAFGQGPTVLSPGDHTRTLTVGDLKRSYLVHIPPKYDSKKPTPLVIAFHGGGGNADSMVTFSGLNKKSDDAGFIVVYPSTASVP